MKPEKNALTITIIQSDVNEWRGKNGKEFHNTNSSDISFFYFPLLRAFSFRRRLPVRRQKATGERRAQKRSRAHLAASHRPFLHLSLSAPTPRNSDDKKRPSQKQLNFWKFSSLNSQIHRDGAGGDAIRSISIIENGGRMRTLNSMQCERCHYQLQT